MTSPELDDLLGEARELEGADSADYAGAKVAHPNREKAQILTVRLTDHEMSRLRNAAAERGLPASAIVRAALAHELQDDDENSTRALMTALRDHHLAVVRVPSRK